MPTEERFTFTVTSARGDSKKKYRTKWKLTREDAAARVASGEWLAAEAIELSREVRNLDGLGPGHFSPHAKG